MAKLNAEYGSELHLLRYLGRHRHDLHRHIERVVPGRMIDWIDFKFEKKNLDAEWEGLDFLPDYFLQKHKDILRQLKAGQSVRNAAKITGKGVSTVQRVKLALA